MKRMISVWHDIGSDGAEELEGSNEFQMFRTSYAGGDKNASGPKRTQKKIEAGCFRYF
jgi:hypothetical protein